MKESSKLWFQPHIWRNSWKVAFWQDLHMYSVKHILTIRISYTSQGYLSKRNEIICPQKKYAHIHSTYIQYGQKLETTQYPSIDEWINKQWYIHTVGYYSTMERDKLLIWTTIWIKPQLICWIKKAEDYLIIIPLT